MGGVTEHKYCAYYSVSSYHMDFPGGSDSKESACNAGDLGSNSQLERSPGEGHRDPCRYSCLENPHGQRRLVSYTVHEVTKSRTQLND